jgi:SPP1 family predicted phage head-tail adaptor
MNPGKLNKRIMLQAKEPDIRDEMGGKMPAAWSDVKSVWAKVQYKSAVKREIMGDHVSSVPVFFTIRETDIDVAMRISYNDEIYDIVNIVELDGIPKYLEVETKLLKPR